MTAHSTRVRRNGMLQPASVMALAMLTMLAVLGAGPKSQDVKRNANKMDNANGSAIAWGKPEDGLRLGLSAEGRKAVFHLENVGENSLVVLSYVDAGEVHLDWYSLSIKDAAGHTRSLMLSDNREQSAQITERLEPKAAIAHAIDVDAWAARAVNGGKALEPGTYEITGAYHVKAGHDHWAGHLTSGPAQIEIKAGKQGRINPR